MAAPVAGVVAAFVAIAMGNTRWYVPGTLAVAAFVAVAMLLKAGNAKIGALGVAFPFRLVRWGAILRFVEDDGHGKPPAARGNSPRSHVYVVDRRGRRYRLANLTTSSTRGMERNVALVRLLDRYLETHLDPPELVFPVRLRADARVTGRAVAGVVCMVLALVYAWFASDGPTARWIAMAVLGVLLALALTLLWVTLTRHAEVTPSEVVLSRALRTRRLPLERVAHFTASPFAVHLESGETVPLGGHDHAGVVPGLNAYLAHLRQR